MTEQNGSWYEIRSLDDTFGIGDKFDTLEKAMDFIDQRWLARKNKPGEYNSTFLVVGVLWRDFYNSSGEFISSVTERRTVCKYQGGVRDL